MFNSNKTFKEFKLNLRGSITLGYRSGIFLSRHTRLLLRRVVWSVVRVPKCEARVWRKQDEETTDFSKKSRFFFYFFEYWLILHSVFSGEFWTHTTNSQINAVTAWLATRAKPKRSLPKSQVRPSRRLTLTAWLDVNKQPQQSISKSIKRPSCILTLSLPDLKQASRLNATNIVTARPIPNCQNPFPLQVVN